MNAITPAASTQMVTMSLTEYLSAYRSATRAKINLEEVKGIAKAAKDAVIDSQESYEYWAEYVIFLKSKGKEDDAHYIPAADAVKTINREISSDRKELAEIYLSAEHALKGKMLAYTAEVERQQKAQREAEEARRRAEKEEADRLAQQLVEQACNDPGLIAEAEAITAEAELIAALPVVSTIPTPKAEGISHRDNWKAEVTSIADLVKAAAENPDLLNLLQPNMPAINARAKQMREGLNIPGVRVFNDKVIAARTK